MSYKNDFAGLVTALSAGLLTGGVHEIVTAWPNIGLWGFTWFSIGSVAMSVAIALIMYLGVFGTTRGAQAVFACALIALCIANYISFEQIEAALARRDYDEAYFLYLIKLPRTQLRLGLAPWPSMCWPAPSQPGAQHPDAPGSYNLPIEHRISDGRIVQTPRFEDDRHRGRPSKVGAKRQSLLDPAVTVFLRA